MADLDRRLRLRLCSGMVQRRGTEDVREALQDLLRCADPTNLSLMQESDAVALPHLVQIGRRDHDRDPLLPLQLLQHRPKLLARDGIHPGCGLIEEQHPWRMDQGARQGQLLFHTPRELARLAILEGLDLPIDVGHQSVVRLNSRAEDGREKLEVLLYR